jgi:hypothetical protein
VVYTNLRRNFVLIAKSVELLAFRFLFNVRVFLRVIVKSTSQLGYKSKYMSKTECIDRLGPFTGNLVVILFLLLRCGTACAQWMVGASGHALILPASNNDYNTGSALSTGISIEVGREFSFGWLFLEGTWINHRLVYNQTVPQIYQNTSGQTIILLNNAGSYGGIEFPAGFQSGQKYSASFPSGPQYFISASYCYVLDSLIMFGPVIGFGWQKDVAIQAATIQDPNNSAVYSSPVYGPPGGGNPGTEIVGNFGFAVKITVKVMILLEYATKTGAGLGVGVPF